MNISIFIATLAVSFIAMLIMRVVAMFHDDDCEEIRFEVVFVVLFTVFLIVSLLSAAAILSFHCWASDIKTYEKTETIEPVRLAQFTTIKGTEHYLVQDGEKFQYSTIDKTNGLKTHEAAAGHSKVHYGAKEADDIYVIVHKTIKIHHDQWLFIRGDDEKNISYEYDFYIPSKKDILYAYGE